MESQKQPKKGHPVAKVIIVGGQSVGKTSILQRYVDGTFSQTAPTLGVDSRTKLIEVDGVKFKMQIWDTTGQERFRSLAKNFFRGANGAIFALDLTDEASFETTKSWVEQCNINAPENICKLILANKYDLAEERVISDEKLKELSKQLKIPYFLVSAKSGENINESIMALGVEIKRRFLGKGPSDLDNRARGFSLVPTFEETNTNTNQSNNKSCCKS